MGKGKKEESEPESSGSDEESSEEESSEEEQVPQEEEQKAPSLVFSQTTMAQMLQFHKEAVSQTKQRIQMTKSERIKGDPKDPVVAKKQKLIDRIRMQPHIKLLIIDSVNFYLSLLEDGDRKALISDLSEQQRVLDAKAQADKGGKNKQADLVNEYLQKRDDLEYRTLQELNQQMTNWVETVQSQAFNGPADLENAEQLLDQVSLESEEDYFDEDVKPEPKPPTPKPPPEVFENSGTKLAREDQGQDEAYPDEDDADILSRTSEEEKATTPFKQLTQEQVERKALLKEKKTLQRNANALLQRLSMQNKIKTGVVSDSEQPQTLTDYTGVDKFKAFTEKKKSLPDRYQAPIRLTTERSEDPNSGVDGFNFNKTRFSAAAASQAAAANIPRSSALPGVMNSAKLQPLKTSIDQLKGQIQALQKLQQMSGGPALTLPPISPVGTRFKTESIPEDMLQEHEEQNMASMFKHAELEEQRKTQNQFKVFQFCHSIKAGTLNYDMLGNSTRQYILPNIREAEFMSLSPQSSALLVKNSNQAVDVLDGETLDLAFSLKVDQAKCIFLSQKLIFVGTWHALVLIYDVTKEFKCVATIQVKQGVRTLTQIDEDILVCGENDGYIDLISISQQEHIVGRRFESIGHIYSLQATSLRNEVVICSYTGVHFVKVLQDLSTGMMSLHLNPIAYVTDQFVNRVVEYQNGRFLAAVWDSSRYVMIDHEQEKMGKQVIHPQKDKVQIRCWGLAKIPGFDFVKLPFIISRDNTGIVLIDVRNCLAYQFAMAPIKANLYGHGDILRVATVDTVVSGKKVKNVTVWTVMQFQEGSMKATVVSVQLPLDLSLALQTLVKID